MILFYWIARQGIEQGFQNAIAGAEHAVVVTTPEVSAIRDADRIIGLLEASGIRKTDLLINRLRIDMVEERRYDVRRRCHRNPCRKSPRSNSDDEQVVIATNRGEAVAGEECLAGRSYMDICRRLTGRRRSGQRLFKIRRFLRKNSAIFS